MGMEVMQMMMEREGAGIPRDEVRRRIETASTDGTISCAVALRIASDLGVTPRTVGSEIDDMGLKIVHCQLGCFP